MGGPAGRDRYSGVNKDSRWSARKAILFRNPTAANLCKCNAHPRRRNARQREPASSWGTPTSYRKQGFFQVLPQSYPVTKDSVSSDGPRASQEPHRQQEQCAKQSQNAVNGDTHNTKWKKQQPNKRINHQRQQRERPT